MLEKAKIVAAVVGVALFLAVVLQNTSTVEVHFLWMQGSLPLAALLLLTLAAGALGGWLVSKLLRMRRSR